MFARISWLTAPVLAAAMIASAAAGEVEELDPAGKPKAEPKAAPEPEPARKYGYLGITLKAVPAEVAEHLGLEDGRGLVIGSVEKGSPAEKAGLAPKDIIVKIDAQIIFSVEQLQKLVASIKPGTTVTVERIRKGRTAAAKATLGGTARCAWRERGPEAMQFWRKSIPRGGAAVPPGAPGGGPRVFFRWRVPGKGWKQLGPGKEDWKEFEDLYGKFKEDVPEAARKAMKKAMEEYKRAMEAARKVREKARAGGKEADSPGPAVVVLERDGYRVRWSRTGKGKARVSLYKKDGTAIFEDVAEDDLVEKTNDLDAAAKRLIEQAKQTAGGDSSGFRVIIRKEPPG
jgi:hypothetical protein